jgi:hypothetical protein
MTPRSRVGIDVFGSRVDGIDPVLCDYDTYNGSIFKNMILENLQVCFIARTSIMSTCTKHKLPSQWQALIRFQCISLVKSI